MVGFSSAIGEQEQTGTFTILDEMGDVVMQGMPRREFITRGGAALAGAAAYFVTRHASAFPGRPGEKVVPWIDTLAPNPVPDVVQVNPEAA